MSDISVEGAFCLLGGVINRAILDYKERDSDAEKFLFTDRFEKFLLKYHYDEGVADSIRRKVKDGYEGRSSDFVDLPRYRDVKEALDKLAKEE